MTNDIPYMRPSIYLDYLKIKEKKMLKGLHFFTADEFILPVCKQYHLNDCKNVVTFIIVLKFEICDNHKMEKNYILN